MSINTSTLLPMQHPIDPRIAAVVTADATHDFQKIFKAIQNCESAPPCSLQEIETALRQESCGTYLIARKNMSPAMSPEWPVGTIKTYMLWLSVRPEAVAMQEVLQESSSCSQNFEKLEHVGILRIKKDMPLLSQLKGVIIKLTPAGEQIIAQEMAAI